MKLFTKALTFFSTIAGLAAATLPAAAQAAGDGTCPCITINF